MSFQIGEVCGLLVAIKRMRELAMKNVIFRDGFKAHVGGTKHVCEDATKIRAHQGVYGGYFLFLVTTLSVEFTRRQANIAARYITKVAITNVRTCFTMISISPTHNDALIF